MKPFKSSGEYLKAVRLTANLTQTELAKKIKCGSQSISNAERGVASLPMELVCRIQHEVKRFDMAMFISILGADYAKKYMERVRAKVERLEAQKLNRHGSSIKKHKRSTKA